MQKEKVKQHNSENFVKFENFKDEELDNVLSEEENKEEKNKEEKNKEQQPPQGEKEKVKKEKSSSGSYGLIKSDSINKK